MKQTLAVAKPGAGNLQKGDNERQGGWSAGGRGWVHICPPGIVMPFHESQKCLIQTKWHSQVYPDLASVSSPLACETELFVEIVKLQDESPYYRLQTIH